MNEGASREQILAENEVFCDAAEISAITGVNPESSRRLDLYGSGIWFVRREIQTEENMGVITGLLIFIALLLCVPMKQRAVLLTLAMLGFWFYCLVLVVPVCVRAVVGLLAS